MPHIGFIGLGHMGNPMVKNLLKHGHQVTVFDIQFSAIEALVAEGAKPAKKASDIAKEADVIFTMLQTGQQVKEVCLGDEGFFAHLQPGTLYIDSSSIDIETTRFLHKEAEAHTIDMLDAPVSGGVAGAEAATLTIMVGGEEDIFERAKPILSCIGKRIIHAGPAGNGQVAKICNNMILGVSMIAISEAFVLGEKLGLPPEKLFEICSNASGQCWSLTNYCPVPGLVANSPANYDYKPGFTARMMLKDLRLSQDASQVADVATPLGAEATALYTLFINEGHENTDFSGIIKMLRGD